MLKKKAKNEVSSSNENKNKNEETKKKSKEDKKVTEVKEKPKIFHLDFKSLRNVLQQILNKINSLMLPLIKNCRSDKVQMSLYSPNIHGKRVFRLDILIILFPQAAMFLSCLATDIVVGLGSWVESDAQKVENTKTETDDQLEVLK